MSERTVVGPDYSNFEFERRSESLLMYRVATKHFYERRSNLDIARELGISRFRVARLLEQAFASNVVEIRVAFPANLDLELSASLAAAFDLRDALVLPDGGDQQWRVDGVAALATGHVAQLVQEGDRLGLAWQQSLDDVLRIASHLQVKFPNVDVVQLVGGVVSPTGGLDASDLVRRFSILTRGASVVLNAPIIVPSAAVASGLRAERSVSAALRAGETSSVAFFGVGGWERGHSALWEVLNDVDRESVAAAGAVAEICGVPLTAAGTEVQSGVRERVIGIGSDSLRRIPRRVAVVLGEDRTIATAAALRSGLVTDLVVNSAVARELIRVAGPQLHGKGTAGNTLDHQ